MDRHTPVKILPRPNFVAADKDGGYVIVLLICVQILVRLDFFSHSITMEV